MIPVHAMLSNAWLPFSAPGMSFQYKRYFKLTWIFGINLDTDNSWEVMFSMAMRRRRW